MSIDLTLVDPEDLKPVADMMLAMPPEKRGEVSIRVQRAAREFLAKSASEQWVAAERETDPVRRVVYGALVKQVPASAAKLDPLKREALGTLVKAVTAGARAQLGKRDYGDIDRSVDRVSLGGKVFSTVYGSNPVPILAQYRGYYHAKDADNFRRKVGGSPKKTPKDLPGRGARIAGAMTGAYFGAGLGRMAGGIAGSAFGPVGSLVGRTVGALYGGYKGGVDQYRRVRDAQLWRRDHRELTEAELRQRKEAAMASAEKRRRRGVNKAFSKDELQKGLPAALTNAGRYASEAVKAIGRRLGIGRSAGLREMLAEARAKNHFRQRVLHEEADKGFDEVYEQSLRLGLHPEAARSIAIDARNTIMREGKKILINDARRAAARAKSEFHDRRIKAVKAAGLTGAGIAGLGVGAVVARRQLSEAELRQRREAARASAEKRRRRVSRGA
jgi:hypothetical protein